MPRFDRTGPEGQGPMTGRRMGRCTNYGKGAAKPENEKTESTASDEPQVLPGRGFRMGRLGRAMGRGRQNRNRGGF